MNKEDYVSFEVAKLLKEKGFREYVSAFFECHGGKEEFCIVDLDGNYNYEGGIYLSAPTLWQAAKWLRGKGWQVQVMLNGVRTMYFVRVYEIVGNGKVVEVPGQYETYESALAAGIESALKLI